MMASRVLLIVTGLLAVAAGSAAAQYHYDPGDFAAEVVAYYPGNSGQVFDWLSPGYAFTDPQVALGRPTVDTCGDDWYIAMDDPVPVIPTYPAFRYYEICTVGYDSHREGTVTVYDGTGYIELKFDHRVFDNPLNPYGSDIIVFGNTKQVASNQQKWDNGNPQNVTVGPNAFTEPGAVLVSQDGVTWYRLPDPGKPAGGGQTARGADDFAPTLGRVYDPANPDTSINTPYWQNLWWGHPTNPTYPLDPAIRPADLAGMTVAEVAAAYKGSAGGTGLDLQDLDPADYAALATDPQTGMKWIQYVRIENPKDGDGHYYGVSTEIDAVADVFARRPGDCNLDGIVNAADYMVLKRKLGQPAGVDWWESGDFDGDGVVGMSDLAALIANFGLDNGEYGLSAAGGRTTSAPEPTTALLLLLSGPALLRRTGR